MTDNDHWSKDTSLFPPRRSRFRRRFLAALIVCLVALPVSPFVAAAVALLLAWFGQ